MNSIRKNFDYLGGEIFCIQLTEIYDFLSNRFFNKVLDLKIWPSKNLKFNILEF